MSDRSSSTRAYLVLMLFLVAVKLALMVAAGGSTTFRSPAQAAVFAWWFIALLTVVGLGATRLAAALGLPDTWNPEVPRTERVVRPALVGVILGALAVAVDLVTGWAARSAAQHGVATIHIPWPWSLPVYTGGAIIVSVIYYLVPLTALLWLAYRWPGARARPAPWYWGLGALLALVEPLTQDLAQAGPAWQGALVFGQDYLLNLTQVAFFRRAGFGAAVVVRVAFYLVWHVLWGFRA